MNLNPFNRNPQGGDAGKEKELLDRLNQKEALPIVTDVDTYAEVLAKIINEKTANPKNILGDSPDPKRLNFEDEVRKVIDFRGGSFAVIYKNELPVRIAPFIWALDQKTRRTWAIFKFNDFYGHKYSLMPWKRISEPIVLTPFIYDSNMVDSYGKGYYAKFDEGTQFQVPISMKYSKEAWADLMDSKQHISSALTLWMDLTSYTKNKLNIKLIIAIVLIAVVCVLGYFMWPTITKMLGGILPH